VQRHEEAGRRSVGRGAGYSIVGFCGGECRGRE
jgi:hypothetical protein